jgi:hypothetical protein
MQERPSRRSFLKKAALAGSGVVLGAAGLNELSPKIWPEPIVFEPNQVTGPKVSLLKTRRSPKTSLPMS